MNIKEQIQAGDFSKAEENINSLLSQKDISATDQYELNFLKDKMHRLVLDFNKSEDFMLNYLDKYYKDVTADMLTKWEKDKSIEYMTINGEKKYFSRAHTNFFLLNKEAKKIKESVDGKSDDDRSDLFKIHLPAAIESLQNGSGLSQPVNYTLNYTLTVKANAVPENEIIRCWLPYPREGHSRQTGIRLISASEDNYIMADKNTMQRTLYMEKKAVKDQPTVFNMKLSYTAYAEYPGVSADKIKDYNKESDLYKLYTSERAPHIVFTDELKKLSTEIVGNETNPYNKAKLIFTWISNNIPWAGSREYSTLENIPMYCIQNGHGDCGIKSLLFMTLCRYNGIPTKWQSGWMLHPGEVNLHDWCEAYFEPFGWVPVDQSFGLQKFSDDPKVIYYFLGGMDAYRMVVNDDYSQPLYPAKIYPRSETVDFQRGEVEWRCGNIYFNDWDYHMDVEYK